MVFCLVLLALAAVLRQGRLWGHALHSPDSAAPAVVAPAADEFSPVSTVLVDSTPLASDVRGFAGPVPVEVEVRDGLVVRVTPQPNGETPGFFARLADAGLWNAWDQLPVEVAATSHVDAVTSATFSSKAAIANVRAALAEAARLQGSATPPDAPTPADAKEPATATAVPTLAALAVLIAAAVLPLFVKSRLYRTLQLALDVAVLGLWSGLFLSTARLLGWMESGLSGGMADLLAAFLLLAMAFLYPVFGRPAHYCMQVCPFGAAQELASRIPARKWRLPPRCVRALGWLRRTLWAALLLLLLSGLWAGWMEWELFGAFAWRAVPPVVLALAVVFLVLSVFVPRAYCRFVCPTGSLFKFIEGN